MDMRLHAFNLGAGTAAFIAVLALAACQNMDSPTPPATAEKGTSDPALRNPDARPMPEGRKATDEEVARFLATRKDAPAVNLAQGAAPLAKTAALATCTVDFNQVNALDRLPDDGYRGISYGPTHYAHTCNGNYFAFGVPLNTDQYRLTPEAANWCTGSPYNIGTWQNWSCVNQNSAIYSPRKAGNMGGNSGIRFYVLNATNTAKNFDLQAIYINSGTAQIVAYRPGIGWWVWYPLNAGSRWYWPAGTQVSEIQVFDVNQNGTIVFDNLEIAIRP